MPSFQAAASKTLQPVTVPEAASRSAVVVKISSRSSRAHGLDEPVHTAGGAKAALPVSTVGKEVELHERDAELDTLREYKAGRDKWLSNRKVWEAELAKLPETEHTREFLTAQEAFHDLISKVLQKARLKAKNVPHDCPSCKHHWEDADPRLESEFKDVPDEAPVAVLSLQEIAQADKALGFADRRAELLALINEADAIQVDTEEQGPIILAIEAARKAYAAAETARANQARLVDLEAAHRSRM